MACLLAAVSSVVTLVESFNMDFHDAELPLANYVEKLAFGLSAAGAQVTPLNSRRFEVLRKLIASRDSLPPRHPPVVKKWRGYRVLLLSDPEEEIRRAGSANTKLKAEAERLKEQSFELTTESEGLLRYKAECEDLQQEVCEAKEVIKFFHGDLTKSEGSSSEGSEGRERQLALLLLYLLLH
ncbi:hypothetical protein Efla_002787 [Eimeria flavescens]